MELWISFTLMLLVGTSTAMALNEDEPTMDVFASISAVFFTMLLEGSKLWGKDTRFNLLKRIINLEDISPEPSTFAGTLWKDPHVRLLVGLTVFGLATQIFGLPNGQVAFKRRKRQSKITPG